MKSIDFIRRDFYFQIGNPHTECYPLPNFNLCKNITRIDEELHQHDLDCISDLPKLKFLRIYGEIEDSSYLGHFHQINFSSLKYLILSICTNFESIFNELSKAHFPSLKRLIVINSKEDTSKSLANSLEGFIRNVPSLTSIHLKSRIFHGVVSGINHQFIFKMLKDANVIIIDSIKEWTEGRELENFLLMKDSAIYGKYKYLKNEYRKWENTFG